MNNAPQVAGFEVIGDTSESSLTPLPRRPSRAQSLDQMKALAKSILLLLAVPLLAILPLKAATPQGPEKRDIEVLNALLLHLLSDTEFNMTEVPTNGATIILHARTPEKTGFLLPHQMRADVGPRILPNDIIDDLQKRNRPENAKPKSYDADAVSFTNLTFSAGIIVADLSPIWNSLRFNHGFEDVYPKARGYLRAYLPGYSKDGTRALVRASVGPSPHGAMLTALLEKSGDRWVVKWHHIARYV